jgi:NAD(P)-dependent dehydrogenase (short-subunit alcohol dehydrogenase family)
MMSVRAKFELEDKVAIVTGGVGFLGRKICKGLLEYGASVAVVDVDVDVDEVTEWASSANTDRLVVFECDVSCKKSVSACVEAVVKKFGKVDVLFNNAATKTERLSDFFSPFEEYPIDVWRKVMSVNIDGMFLMAQAVGPHMLDQGSGTIIQTSSIYGAQAPDHRIYSGSMYLGLEINSPAVYSASKAAVIGLTKWLATYWADKGIRVNCLVPGGVESGQNDTFNKAYSARIPLGRMADADEIVPIAIYLASEASSYVTGQVISVDGGLSAW